MAKTPSSGIDQNGDGKFIDKYWGRVPQMLHSIPEANIWVCNPEYVLLMEMYVANTLNENDVSHELWAEIRKLFDSYAGGILLTEKEKKILECYDKSGVPPGEIIDFSATGGGGLGDVAQRGYIEMNWSLETFGIPASVYELYEGVVPGTLIRTGIAPGHKLYVNDQLQKNYYVMAKNKAGFTLSNVDPGQALTATGAPSGTHLTATNEANGNAFIGSVYLSWIQDEVGYPDAATYELYEDGILIDGDAKSPYHRVVEAGSRVYTLSAVNSVGSSSDVTIGDSLAVAGAPGAILLFNASDDSTSAITFTWINEGIGNPAPTYQVYEDDVAIPVTDQNTPWVPASPGKRNYYVVATNSLGSSISNDDYGSLLGVKSPPKIENLRASDDIEGEVLIEWNEDANEGILHVTYELHFNGVLIHNDVASPFRHYPPLAGTHTYLLIATNADGDDELSVDGTSLPATEDTLTLPQFDKTTSIGIWLESQAVDTSNPLRIINPAGMIQPTLVFDGVMPTTRYVVFENNGDVIGTEPGDNAIELHYPVRIVNSGLIAGAGGNGGKGGTFEEPDQVICTNCIPYYKPAFDGYYAGYYPPEYGKGGPGTSAASPGSTPIATFAIAYDSVTNQTPSFYIESPFGNGTANYAFASGSAYIPITLGGNQYYVSFSNAISGSAKIFTGLYTLAYYDNIQQGSTYTGGNGGKGESFLFTSPNGGLEGPDAGINPGNGGGIGGTGGILGEAGENGDTRTTTGSLGAPSGYGVSGASNLSSASNMGIIKGGTS